MKVQLHCPHCNSTNVVADAIASWSADDHDWELHSTYDNKSCLDCEHEFHSATEVEIPDDLSPLPANPQAESFNITLTPEQREALMHILDLAFEDQSNYLDSGHMATDFGADWPEARATKAATFRTIAEIAGQQLRIHGEFERWADLASSVEEIRDGALVAAES